MPQYQDSISVQITALQRWPLAQLLNAKLWKLQSLLQTTARKSSSFQKASVLHASRLPWRAGVERKAFFIPLSVPADILSLWSTNPQPYASRIGPRIKSLVSWVISPDRIPSSWGNFFFFRASCCLLLYIINQSLNEIYFVQVTKTFLKGILSSPQRRTFVSDVATVTLGLSRKSNQMKWL